MENDEEGCASMPQGNTGGMVEVVVAGGRDSRALGAPRETPSAGRGQPMPWRWYPVAASVAPSATCRPHRTWHLQHMSWWQLGLRGREGAARRPCPRPSKREDFFF